MIFIICIVFEKQLHINIDIGWSYELKKKEFQLQQMFECQMEREIVDFKMDVQYVEF